MSKFTFPRNNFPLFIRRAKWRSRNEFLRLNRSWKESKRNFRFHAKFDKNRENKKLKSFSQFPSQGRKSFLHDFCFNKFRLGCKKVFPTRFELEWKSPVKCSTSIAVRLVPATVWSCWSFFILKSKVCQNNWILINWPSATSTFWGSRWALLIKKHF